MILEELITLIGFRVEGIDKLRNARRQLDNYRTGLAALGTSAKRQMAVWGAAFDKGSSRTTIMGGRIKGATTAAGGFRAALLRGVAAAALLKAGVATLGVGAGLVLTKLAGQAARVREEFQLLSQSQGTKANFAEQLTSLYKVAGLDDAEKQGPKSLDKLSGKMTEARTDEDAAKKIAELGIAIKGQNGQMRDTTAVALDVLREIARSSAEERKASSEGDKAKIDKRIRDLGELIGVDDASLQRFRNMSEPEVRARLGRAQTLFPARSDEDDAASAERAQRWNAISTNFEAVTTGLATQLGKLRDLIADNIIGPFERSTEGMVRLAKKIGLIDETQDERNLRLEMLRESTRGTGARVNPDATDDLSLRRTNLERSRQRILGMPDGNTKKRLLGEIDAKLEGAKRDLQQGPSAPGPQSGMWESIKGELSGAASQLAAAAAAGTLGAKSFENIGNDQRQQSVTVHVTANGLGEIAGAAARGAASSLSKGTTASTAAAGVGP